MLSEPSLMIFSGPIVSRLVAAGEQVAGAQAGLDHLVEPVGVRRHPDPQQVAPSSHRSAQSSAPPLNSKSTMPATPMRGRGSMVRW